MPFDLAVIDLGVNFGDSEFRGQVNFGDSLLIS